MIRNLDKFRPLAVSALQDAAGIGGAGLVAYGVGQIYAPLGVIVAGGFLLAGSWLAARAKR